MRSVIYIFRCVILEGDDGELKLGIRINPFRPNAILIYNIVRFFIRWKVKQNARKMRKTLEVNTDSFGKKYHQEIIT
jgi:hypothetical protein